MEYVIKRVFKNTSSDQKLLSLPKSFPVEAGEYALILKFSIADLNEFSQLPRGLQEKILNSQGEAHKERLLSGLTRPAVELPEPLQKVKTEEENFQKEVKKNWKSV